MYGVARHHLSDRIEYRLDTIMNNYYSVYGVARQHLYIKNN